MSIILSETPPKFAGHETFTLRDGWLKKAVDATGEYDDIFLRDDTLVTLGVGKNMVRSIRPSPLGSLLFGPHGLDPYLNAFTFDDVAYLVVLPEINAAGRP